MVCGTKGVNKIPDGCWHQLVTDALKPHCVSEPADDGQGEVLRFRKNPPEPAQAAAGAPSTREIALPPWLTRNAAPDVPKWRTIAPSSAAEDNIRPSAAPGSRDALLRGMLVHRLMQSLPDLPAARRRQAAADFLARAGDALPPAERDRLAAQVMHIFDEARFRDLFAPGSRAEVPIVGRLMMGGEEVRISGQVDRLTVTQDAVLIADFKTTRNPPRRIEDAPPDYVSQLALYRAVLAQLYPDKLVRAALIWTEVPDVMELSGDALDDALARITPA